jgi:hypothetical protein
VETSPAPAAAGRRADDPARGSEHGRHRARRTRAEARARGASQLSTAGEPGGTVVTA